MNTMTQGVLRAAVTTITVLLLAHIASAGLAPTATITTVAGISLAEQRLRAREIAIGGPYVLAADGKAGLYFTDQTQGVVYHAFPDGTISVIAGGASLPRMLRADAPIGDGGKALEASFQRLNGLAVDRSGSIFIADRNRVRRITPDGIITTIAGSGTCGLPGDGGPATLASICDPMGMAVDIEGNLFIVEPNQNRVRRVTPNGEISTVAGTGKEQGPLGDGGPARQATLLYPTGVAFDKAGNLYIADSGHFRVRKVSPSGEITTIAGTGREGSSGDGGPAIRARIYAAGVTVDAEGNVFIADANRVRKVDTQGIISTVVGTGVSGFGGDDAPAAAALIATMELEAPLAGPINIAMDSSGVLFIGDQKNYRIRSVNPKGIISTFAGNGTRGFSGDGGSALRAQFLAPRDIVVDPTGGFYVADSSNYRIRKVSPDGVVTTVVGNGDDGFSGDGGPATSAQLNYPDVLTVDASGDLLISDALNRRIRKVSRGVITTVAGNGVVGLASGDGGPAVAARLENPGGIALNLAGELFIADAFTRIRKVDKTGRITTIAGTGKDGTSGDGGLATSASIRAYMVLVDGDGNLFFSGTYGIRKIAPTGIITSVVGTPNGGAGFNGDNVPARAAQVNQPRGMAIGPDGNLYFADTDNHRIRKLTSDGTVITIAGTGVYGFGGDNGPAAEARLAAPVAIAFDREGNLLIADTNNNRIRKITFGR